MFLGAGASAVSPTRLPTFPTLTNGVLQAIGWTPTDDGSAWTHHGYGRFDTAGVAAEVLFGTLSRFHVNFADEVVRVLRGGDPNAVHATCATLLSSGGSVWTTNIDGYVDAACGTMPHRAGRAVSPGLLDPLRAAVPGTLVKFHGTAEAPHTLAFTDRELLAPLPAADIAHLKDLAAGRDMIVYGYPGADADLFGLLEAMFGVAARVLWFEPTRRGRRNIERAPRRAPDFRPEGSTGRLRPRRRRHRARVPRAPRRRWHPDRWGAYRGTAGASAAGSRLPGRRASATLASSSASDRSRSSLTPRRGTKKRNRSVVGLHNEDWLVIRRILWSWSAPRRRRSMTRGVSVVLR
jgi:hypothetical protein